MRALATIATIAVALALLFGCRSKPVAQPDESMQRLVNLAFVTGLRLGYACAQRGGTPSDLDVFAAARESNRVEVVEAWFKERP